MADSGHDDEPESHDGVTDADTDPSRVDPVDRFDFESFGPADMAEMTVEEWETAFDPSSWITGPRLLDRVEVELRDRVARRQLFAVVERVAVGGEDRVLAYTDVGYALVSPDGSVTGEGTVRGEVEPVVALCSIEEYDVPELGGDGPQLPDPDDVGGGHGELGNRLVLAIGIVQILAGFALLVAPLLLTLPGTGSSLLTTVAGIAFIVTGVVLGVLVANARLSDRFRAAEYRERLRAAGVGSDDRPGFLPAIDGDDGGAPDDDS